MKQVLLNMKTGKLSVDEVPGPIVRAGGILVRNSCSLISAGTEREILRLARMGLIGKARKRPDLLRPVITRAKRDGVFGTLRIVRRLIDTPIPLGYSCAGVVMDVGEGVNRFSRGDRVACAGLGYANHAGIVFVPQNLACRVPEGVSMEDAAFVTVGAIAMQGVRIAEASLGENIAVIGLGLIGQVIIQILKAAGCRVIGTDLDSRKVDLADELGLDAGGSGEDSVKSVVDFCGGIGADKVIVAASSTSGKLLDIAANMTRDKGAVVIVGDVPLTGSRRKYYEKELEIRLSRSYGPGRYDPQYEERGFDYPISYVRWTENRNMELFLNLIREGKVKLSSIITHRFNIEEALKAYDLMEDSGELILGVLLTYRAEQARAPFVLKKPATPKGDRLRLGIIGAGNFARGVLLPAFKKTGRVTFRAVVTGSGVTAASVAKSYDCDYAASRPEELLEDDSIDALIIATRHDLHAGLIAKSMSKGKIVFSEKPLALNRKELVMVIEAQREYGGRLMVGFNRRFSPLTLKLQDFFGQRKEPMAGIYRVNAGSLPRSHWTHDPSEGGGRIIGEVCHFIDWYQAVFGCAPSFVEAEQLSGNNPALTYYDTLSATLKFADGSIGVICYFSNGEETMPKERIELFCQGSSAVLGNFRELQLLKGGKKKATRMWSQDKGVQAEVDRFVEAALSGADMPISFESLCLTTETTFKIMEALQSGSRTEIDLSSILVE